MTGRAGRGSARASASSTSSGRGGRSGPVASSSSCRMAGIAATRHSSRPRRRGSGGAATGSSGSTRWPARRATSRSRPGCGPRSRTSTTSCRRAPSPASSASARFSPAFGRAIPTGAARRRRTWRRISARARTRTRSPHVPPTPRRPSRTEVPIRRCPGRSPDEHERSGEAAVRDLLPTIDAWGDAAASAGRAVVVRTFGSAPRPEGAVLLMTADGRIAGSVSGGCVEGAAAEEIERARRTGRSRVIRYGISDEQAWDVGLACGGTIDVLVEPAIPAVALEAARGAVARGRRGTVVVTPLPPDSPPPAFGEHQPGEGAEPAPTLLVDEAGLHGTLGKPDMDAALVEAATDALRRGTSRTLEVGGRSLFLEAFPVRPRLVIVGATEIARSLATIAGTLGYERV